MSRVVTRDQAKIKAATAGYALRLHVWLKGISPMIWRRFLAPAETSLATLHETLQVAFDWDDDHLHRFRVHARDIGLYREGGLSFDADAHAVTLLGLALRRGEKFLYEYNLHVPWQHVIRVEEILLPRKPLPLPTCLGGQGQGPPEGCRSPGEFMDYRDDRTLWLYRRLAEVTQSFLKDGTRPQGKDADELRYWISFKWPDRRKINSHLARLGAGGDGVVRTAKEEVVWREP